MAAKATYWKDIDPKIDEATMKDKVFDPMLDLQGTKDKFKKITRTTYKTISQQAAR
jgi:hypothetical protein